MDGEDLNIVVGKGPLYLDALITDLATGETRRHQCEADYRDCFENGNWPPYIWVEGNYSCDCNLALFFDRAGGEEEAEDYPCGNSRFAYELRVRETGELIFSHNPASEPVGEK